MDQARLRKLYGALPSPLRAAVPHRFEAWARARIAARRAGPATPAGLEARLWGGFSAAALRDLEALAAAGPAPRAAEAAWILARWQAAQGDLAAALGQITAMREIHPPASAERRQFALEALYLARLGRGAEARALITARLRGRPPDPSLALILATSHRPAPGAAPDAAADAATLEAINGLFGRFGLQGIARRDAARPLGLDNLRGTDPGPKLGPKQGPRVSVIVPAFNAEATLATALSSLLDQSHGDLEILVVDDASTDATADIAADTARADPRLRLIRQPRNQGGYAARNRALAEASGALVTLHDADDWSHPDKIALQVRALGRAGSNFSAWVRATPDLAFAGPARGFPDLMMFNDSAALFRRDLFARFGGWDTARVAADRELIERFEHLAGRPRGAYRRRLVLPDCPLSFGRLDPASLTRGTETHLFTMYHGVRREYIEAAHHWQDGLDAARIRRSGFRATAPFFPAPPILRGAAAPDPDLLVIGPFNFRGGTQKCALHMLEAARLAGLKPALMNYPRYDQDVAAPLDRSVRAEAARSGIRIVAPGERLAARTVIVSYPPVFAEPMDRFPRLDHARLVVYVNQMAERDRARSDIAYDPARIRAHLRDAFGSEGLWAPISGRVRAAMAADPRYPAPLDTDWMPLIDARAFAAAAPPWRGATRAAPVLGRHGRDDPLKWPLDPEALRTAYCAGRRCQVRFLGGAFHAQARLARWPGNWRVLPFGAREVRDFLADLDIFLHFPDPDYFEEFGRAPMEAMAVGLPVILPPEFEATFGDAALYAAPAEVWPLVERLWGDRLFWEARAAAGRAFVAEHCDHAVFARRLARLEGA